MCRAPREDTPSHENTNNDTKGTLASGAGAEFSDTARFRRENSPARWPRRLALALIRFYQNAISPHTPPTCFFYPTCSHYTYQAIEKFGFWRGVWLGMCRIVRCHPFAHGGYDPVPEKFLWFPTRRREESHKDLDE